MKKTLTKKVFISQCLKIAKKEYPFPKEKSKPRWEEELGIILKDGIFEIEAGSILQSFKKIFGLIRTQIYLAGKEERKKIIGERKCGKCGFDFIKMWKICPECGAILKRSH